MSLASTGGSVDESVPYKGARDPRFVTVHRGGTLEDEQHRLLAAWAADCAEHVLPLFSAEHPDDVRPHHAIEQARAWSRGEISMAQARARSSRSPVTPNAFAAVAASPARATAANPAVTAALGARSAAAKVPARMRARPPSAFPSDGGRSSTGSGWVGRGLMGRG